MRVSVLGSVMDVSAQFWNASAPMRVKVFGSVMEVSAVHIENVASSISVKLLGSVTDVSPLQPAKAYFLILVTPWGTMTMRTSALSPLGPTTAVPLSYRVPSPLHPYS